MITCIQYMKFEVLPRLCMSEREVLRRVTRRQLATQVDIRKVKTRNQAEIEGREDSFQASLAAALCALSGGGEGVVHLVTLVLCLWK